MLPELVKYAPYIYAAYGVAVAVLIGMVIWSVIRIGAAKKKLDALEAAELKEPPGERPNADKPSGDKPQ